MEQIHNPFKTSGTFVLDGISYDIKKYNENFGKRKRLVDAIYNCIEQWVDILEFISRKSLLWVDVQHCKATVGVNPCGAGFTPLPLYFYVKRDESGELVPDLQEIRDFAYKQWDDRAS